MTSTFLIFKVLHIVGFVTWFFGLFSLLLIFVFHFRIGDQNENANVLKTQFKQMENNIYRLICNPAMMFTFIFGFAMIAVQPEYMKLPWIHVKILLVLILMGVHLYMKKVKSMIGRDQKMVAFNIRLLIVMLISFLAAIISLAVFKANINYLYWIVGLIGVGAISIIGGAKLILSRSAD